MLPRMALSQQTMNIQGYIFENEKTQSNQYEIINILLLLLFSIDNSKWNYVKMIKLQGDYLAL